MPGSRSGMVGRGMCLAVVVIPLLAAGCTGAADRPAACGPIRREALDPNFLIHVLPGAKGVRYHTDPPTSGPHQPAPRLARVQTRPIPRPVQVGILEGGDVLVQYGQLGSADLGRLRKLAGDHVVVAPNPRLRGPLRVVATGWVHKRTCTAVDTGALEEFIRARAGKGPEDP